MLFNYILSTTLISSTTLASFMLWLLYASQIPTIQATLTTTDTLYGE